MTRKMEWIDFNDVNPGTSHSNRVFLGPWSQTGPHDSGGSLDVTIEWTVDRGLIGANTDMLFVRVKGKVATGQPSNVDTDENDQAIMWVVAGTPAGEALGHFMWLTTNEHTRSQPQKSSRRIQYATLFLPIESEKVSLRVGTLCTGAQTVCEISGFIEYGIEFV